MSFDGVNLKENIVKELVGKAKAGDTRALESIIRYSGSSVSAIAKGFYIEGGDMEDLIQEGTMGVLRAVTEYKEEMGVPFKNFMELVVRRHILNAIEKAARQKHRILNSALSISTPINSSSSEENQDMEDILFKNEETTEFKVTQKESIKEYSDEMARALSPFENKVLNEYLEGRSYESIAEILGRDIKSIDNAVQRIRKKLITIFR